MQFPHPQLISLKILFLFAWYSLSYPLHGRTQVIFFSLAQAPPSAPCPYSSLSPLPASHYGLLTPLCSIHFSSFPCAPPSGPRPARWNSHHSSQARHLPSYFSQWPEQLDTSLPTAPCHCPSSDLWLAHLDQAPGETQPGFLPKEIPIEEP